MLARFRFLLFVPTLLAGTDYLLPILLHIASESSRSATLVHALAYLDLRYICLFCERSCSSKRAPSSGQRAEMSYKLSRNLHVTLYCRVGCDQIPHVLCIYIQCYFCLLCLFCIFPTRFKSFFFVNGFVHFWFLQVFLGSTFDPKSNGVMYFCITPVLVAINISRNNETPVNGTIFTYW